MSRKKRKGKNIYQEILGTIAITSIIIFCYFTGNFEIFKSNNEQNNLEQINSQNENISFDLSTIPEYSSTPYVVLNNNTPYFTKENYSLEAFEKYSPEDVLGRSGVAFANICKEIMPQKGEERGEIGAIKPTGWVQKRYDNLIKDKYLYNRCHLIGWQLAGENANKNNLITGTRYLNTEGMLPFENEVAEYINKNENNHVLYRVTPIFEGNNLLASGVQMEALSVEDNGKGVCFNVYCYNVQPGIVINYATGESHAEE